MDYRVEFLIANLAFRFKLNRLCQRRTISYVSADTGCHITAISRMETGAHHFSLKTAISFMVYYELDFEDLFQHYSAKPTRQEWKALDEMEKALIRNLKSKNKHLALRTKQAGSGKTQKVNVLPKGKQLTLDL